MKALKIQVGQVGMALASAFMPFTDKVLPVVMSGATKLAEHIKANSGQVEKFTDDMGTRVNKTDRLMANLMLLDLKIGLGWKTGGAFGRDYNSIVPKAAEARAQIGAKCKSALFGEAELEAAIPIDGS